MFDELNSDKFELFVVVLWMLWFVHNKVVLGEEEPDYNNITSLNFAWAQSYLSSFREANVQQQPGSPRQHPRSNQQ